MKRLPVTKLGLLALFSASVVFAQADGGPDGATMKETEAGIPVTDPLVTEKCSACHTADAKGNLSRISWVRTTPEGWAQAIKRMVRLNGLAITPEESRAIVKSLSASHGLAPEEARPVMYLPEKRIIDESIIPNDTMRGACASCHSYAQPMSWRRSKLEWKTLQDLHVALYSQADAQYRRPAEDSEQPAGRDPKDKLTRGDYALTYMPKVAGLHTPEWAAWSARQRNPRLAGEWLVVASVPGKGRYVGELSVSPGKAADEFTTRSTLRSLSDGGTISRTGTGIVYAGYSWRGSSTGGAAARPDDLTSAARETLWFAPDQQSAQGRWFWGDYQEFGYDVKLVRATAAPAILAVTPGPVKAGTKGVQLRILGNNLPASPSAADIDLGAGITVTKIVSASPKELVVTADVAPAASSGQRDVAIAGAVLEQAFPVFHKIDYIKATPETALSRLGGVKFPKGYQQFEAIGYENGLDGKPNTPDDIAVGPVAADWTMQEFMSVYYDDDTKYVGALSPTAFFTPAEEGPNPARRFGRNNYGEVWVVATAKTEKDKFGKPLSARSYMVVTVPAYQKWDQPEVSR
ncbi:quinohemoprotein amine dehydrogenase subunit alpha [Sphingobium sp. 3R8]|uniref:quinohemoprotein amine dehydrogenase subunit alpha n=1 Tax=Sphingobium sp. 3R8 TaxID=2874921 RepID=UPI001CCF5F27|nr:quinohemoprotein amine dehydrogenase subunit alpha [Sphingobium sp. 3R8]MBZ9647227.1 quinohemoprotein amine dehydrogenase subunit alpha [Sphingobium sp. 3R8]